MYSNAFYTASKHDPNLTMPGFVLNFSSGFIYGLLPYRVM
jgi:hypothetical protein